MPGPGIGPRFWMVLYGLIAGVRFASYYGAITMIPLTLFTIISSLTPVCTQILSRILVGTKLTPLKARDI